MTKRTLVDVYCDKCERFLIAAPRDSPVYCPGCNKWTQATEKQTKTKGE